MGGRALQLLDLCDVQQKLLSYHSILKSQDFWPPLLVGEISGRFC
jgi:hypothetical protein